ncbi:hypothetical protein L1787_04480 [Acuticoccus sp. M5D2P5]|uniref:hypothetical protein n=1 Tax=Acuticoccus kalidii TaxID=2910977 RepID=UPI001F182068|nr:hypothetical protein [Acuticoccus kalidii]MCF3932673.1 hypothetical protein [Acuticoccus kalidii]
MSKNEQFFKSDAFVPLGDKPGASDVIQWLIEQGAEPLTINEANAKNHDELFDISIKHDRIWHQYYALPKIDDNISHNLIPLPFDEHLKHLVEGRTLSAYIEECLNSLMSEGKYIMSCDPRHFVAIKIKKFSYDLIFASTQNGGTNTHFILFDDLKKLWVLFCSEIPFIIISNKKDEYDDEVLGKSRKFWVEYYYNRIGISNRLSSASFIRYLNETYFPRLHPYPAIRISLGS